MTLWLVGGLDPTGGAGVLRDRFTALERAPTLEVITVITATTQQGDGRPARAQAAEPGALRNELVGIDRAAAVKLGVVPEGVVAPIRDALQRGPKCRVLDPVLRASDGGAMGATPAGLRSLCEVVDLLTPNLEEAAALLMPGDDAAHAGAILAARYAPLAVLLKDGHGPDLQRVRDRLYVGSTEVTFDRPRRPGLDPRGTGCALATAIACELAGGADLVDACARAIAWLDEARVDTVAGPDGRPHLRVRTASVAALDLNHPRQRG